MKIVIPGTPIPKKRHKNAGRICYDPQDKIKKETHLLMKSAYSNECHKINGKAPNFDSKEALSVELTFYFPVNDGDSSAIKNAKLWGLIEHTKKPDLDNLEKFYLDCGNLAIYNDDCQVVTVSKRKLYCNNPRTEIEIMASQKKEFSKETRIILNEFSPAQLQDFYEDLDLLSNLNHCPMTICRNPNSNDFPVLDPFSSELIKFVQKYSSQIKNIIKNSSKINS